MGSLFFFKYNKEELLEHILMNFIYKKNECLKNIYIKNGNDKDLFFEQNIFNYIYSCLFKTSKIIKKRMTKKYTHLLNNKGRNLLYLDSSKSNYQKKRNIYIGKGKRRGIYNNIPSCFYKIFTNKKKMKYIQSLYLIIQKMFLMIMNKRANFKHTIRYLFLLKYLMSLFYKFFSIYIIRCVYIKYNNNDDNNNNNNYNNNNNNNYNNNNNNNYNNNNYNNDIIIMGYNSKRKKCSINNFLFLYFKNMKSYIKLTDEYMFMKNYLSFIFIINEIFYIYIWLLYLCLHKYTYDTKKIYLLLKIISDDNYGSLIFFAKPICTYKRKDKRNFSFFLFSSRKDYINERKKLKYKNYKRIICFSWIYKIIKSIQFLASLYKIVCYEKDNNVSHTMNRKYILLHFILKIFKIIKFYGFQRSHPFFTTINKKDILNNNNHNNNNSYYYYNKRIIKRKYYLKLLKIFHIIYEQFIFLLSKKRLYLYFELFFIFNNKRYNKKEEYNSYKFSRMVIYNIINNNNNNNNQNNNFVDKKYYKHKFKNKQNKYIILLLYLYYKIYEYFLELYKKKKHNEWYPKKKKDTYYIMKYIRYVKYNNMLLLFQKNSFFIHLVNKYFVLFILLYSMNRKTNITLHFIKIYIHILLLISEKKNLFLQLYFYKINILTYFLYCINQIIISKKNNFPNYCIQLNNQSKQNCNILGWHKKNNNSHITYNKKNTTVVVPPLKLKRIFDMPQKKINIKQNNYKDYYYYNYYYYYKKKKKNFFFFTTIFKCTYCIYSFKKNVIYPTLFSTKIVLDHLSKSVRDKKKKKKKIKNYSHDILNTKKKKIKNYSHDILNTKKKKIKNYSHDILNTRKKKLKIIHMKKKIKNYSHNILNTRKKKIKNYSHNILNTRKKKIKNYSHDILNTRKKKKIKTFLSLKYLNLNMRGGKIVSSFFSRQITDDVIYRWIIYLIFSLITSYNKKDINFLYFNENYYDDNYYNKILYNKLEKKLFTSKKIKIIIYKHIKTLKDNFSFFKDFKKVEDISIMNIIQTFVFMNKKIKNNINNIKKNIKKNIINNNSFIHLLILYNLSIIIYNKSNFSKHFNIQKKVGQGAYGKIYLCNYNANRKIKKNTCVVKFIDVPENMNQNYIFRNIYNEIKALVILNKVYNNIKNNKIPNYGLILNDDNKCGFSYYILMHHYKSSLKELINIQYDNYIKQLKRAYLKNVTNRFISFKNIYGKKIYSLYIKKKIKKKYIYLCNHKHYIFNKSYFYHINLCKNKYRILYYHLLKKMSYIKCIKYTYVLFILHLFIQIINKLKNIHNKGIAHFDINTNNIMINYNKTFLLDSFVSTNIDYIYHKNEIIRNKHIPTINNINNQHINHTDNKSIKKCKNCHQHLYIPSVNIYDLGECKFFFNSTDFMFLRTNRGNEIYSAPELMMNSHKNINKYNCNVFNNETIKNMNKINNIIQNNKNHISKCKIFIKCRGRKKKKKKKKLLFYIFYKKMKKSTYTFNYVLHLIFRMKRKLKNIYIFKKKKKKIFLTDTWLLGLLLYEMITKKQLFNVSNFLYIKLYKRKDLLKNIINNNINQHFKYIKYLLYNTINFNIKNRKSLNDLRRQTYALYNLYMSILRKHQTVLQKLNKVE
ncbi:protein kinase, putative [Plasmodium sp. gorilla clade G3]|nr:protein kinase, putative [Plasmodium sp. gorilla clade G3]